MAIFPKNDAGTILKAGLLAGTLDISIASLQFFLRTEKNPVIVLKYIASAVFGRTIAYADGALMPLLGLLFHYIIAFGWTILFFYTCRKLTVLWKYPIPAGLLYGIFVWTMMKFAVLPLTKVAPIPFDLAQAAIAAGILIVAIGLPVSLICSKYYREKLR